MHNKHVLRVLNQLVASIKDMPILLIHKRILVILKETNRLDQGYANSRVRILFEAQAKELLYHHILMQDMSDTHETPLACAPRSLRATPF